MQQVLQPNARVTPQALVRAVVEHPCWYVPLGSLLAVSPDASAMAVGRLTMPAGGNIMAPPSDDLWLFSDEAAVRQAPQLGFGTLSGLELSSLFPCAWETLYFNPQPDRDALILRIMPPVLGRLQELRLAVPVEISLASGILDIDAIYGHPSFWVPLLADEAVTVPITQRGVSRAVPVFTASDCVAAWVGALSDSARERLEVVPVTGVDLLTKVLLDPIDAIVFNLMGPATCKVVDGAAYTRLVGHVR